MRWRPSEAEREASFLPFVTRVLTLRLALFVHRIAEYGEHSIECAPAYVEYAKALLRKAQAEGDPFGGALSKDKAQDAVAGSSGDPAGEAADEEHSS